MDMLKQFGAGFKAGFTEAFLSGKINPVGILAFTAIFGFVAGAYVALR